MNTFILLSIAIVLIWIREYFKTSNGIRRNHEKNVWEVYIYSKFRGYYVIKELKNYEEYREYLRNEFSHE